MNSYRVTLTHGPAALVAVELVEHASSADQAARIAQRAHPGAVAVYVIEESRARALELEEA